jgi:hypothetical protein
MTPNWSFSSFALLYLDNGKALRGESWDVNSKERSLHEDVVKLSHLTLVMSANGAIRHCRIFENSENLPSLGVRLRLDSQEVPSHQTWSLGPRKSLLFDDYSLFNLQVFDT